MLCRRRSVRVGQYTLYLRTLHRVLSSLLYRYRRLRGRRKEGQVSHHICAGAHIKVRVCAHLRPCVQGCLYGVIGPLMPLTQVRIQPRYAETKLTYRFSSIFHCNGISQKITYFINTIRRITGELKDWMTHQHHLHIYALTLIYFYQEKRIIFLFCIGE